MHNATHMFSTSTGDVYVRRVTTMINRSKSTARVVRDHTERGYLPGEQIIVKTADLISL